MADISLLFDVEGGGSISSGSGKLINDQLSSIVRQINSTPFEVTFKADEKSIAAIKSQLQDIFKTTGGIGNAPVAIPTLSLDTSNIKKELAEIKQEFDSLTKVATGRATTPKSSSKSVSAGGKTSSSTTDLVVDDRVLTRAANAIRTMETYRKSLIKSTDVDTSELDRVISGVRELSSLYASGEVAVEDYTQAFDRLNREFAEFRLDSSANDALRDQISILSKVASLRSSMDKLRTSDVNASDADLRSVSMMTNRLGSLEDDYFSGGINLSEFSKEVSKVESDYRQLANARKEENALIEKKASLLNRVLQVQTSIAKAEQRTKGKIWDTEDADNTTLTKIKSESDRLRNSIAELDTGDVDVMAHALSRMEDELDSVVTGFREYSLATANVGRESIKATDGVKEYEAIMRKLHKTSVETHNALEKYGAAKYGKSGAEYKNLERLYSNISAAESNIGTRIDSGVSVGELAAEVDKYTSELVKNTSAIKRNNEAHKSSFGHLGELASKFAQWFSLTQVMSTVFRWTRSMVDEVIAIDSAMTELRKVTDETDATYDNFLTNAAQRSRELGSSISDTVNATADFTRLGYSIEEAEAMADAAIVYKTVGDGIEDITEASESIIATMQAFGDETLSAMGIVDKFNNVGNSFAISSKGVGEALLRSAAAMSAANNTIDETIALAAASNTIVQDPLVVGTTLKTISMFLRASKTEAEEAGEETEGMANSISELRGEILALTGNKVDIQVEGKDEFKSTYQILKELSEVWDSLSDISQANILEMVGGKRNANVVAAIIENFDIAEDALATSLQSEGSALDEHAKAMDSVEGRINTLKSSFANLSETLLDAEDIKTLLSSVTAVVDAFTALSKGMNFIGGIKTELVATLGILATFKADEIVGTLVDGFGLLKKHMSDLPISHFVKGFNEARRSGESMTNSFRSGFSSVAASASTATVAFSSITAILTVLIAAYSAYNQAREESIRKSSEEAAKAAELVDSARSLSSSYSEYAEYASMTERTVEQEGAMNNALQTVISSLGEKASVLNGLTEGTREYEAALRSAVDAELRSGYASAVEGEYNARNALMTKSTGFLDVGKLRLNIGANHYGSDEYKLIESIMGEFLTSFGNGKTSNGLQGTHSLDTNYNDIGQIVKYFQKLEELKEAIAISGDVDNSFIYKDLVSIINEYSSEIELYKSALYDLESIKYTDSHGVPSSQKDRESYYVHMLRYAQDVYDVTAKTAASMIEAEIAAEGYSDVARSISTDMLAAYDAESSRYILENGAPIGERQLSAYYVHMLRYTQKTRGVAEDIARTMVDAEFAARGFSDAINSAGSNSPMFYADGNDLWGDLGVVNPFNFESASDGIKSSLSNLIGSEDFADIKEEITAIVYETGRISPDAISALCEESQVLAELLKEDGMSARFLAHILTTELRGENGIDLIADGALELNEALEGLTRRFAEVTEAKRHYDEVMSIEEKDSNFKSIADAFKTLNDEFVAGTTNSNAFWAAAEYIFGEEQLSAWGWEDGLQSIYDAMSANVEVFEDAESAGFGFIKRFNQISDGGKILNEYGDVIAEIKELSDGGFDIDIDGEAIPYIAEKMMLSEEAVLACIEALGMWGDIDFYNIDEVIEKAEKLNLVMSKSDGNKIINVDGLDEQLRNLGFTAKEINDIKEELSQLNGVTLIGAEMQVEDLVESLESLGVITSDELGVEVDFDALTDLFEELGFTEDQAKDTIKKLSEMNNLRFLSLKGELGSVDDAMSRVEDLDLSSVRGEMDRTTSSVDNLATSLSKIDGKKYTFTVQQQLLGWTTNDNNTPFKPPTNTNGRFDGLWTAGADGIKNAKGGIALTGEEGEELVQSGSTARLVGTNGPEFTHLKPGDRVYTAEETKKIKKSLGKVSGRIPAFAGGGVYGGISGKKWNSLLDDSSGSSSGSNSYNNTSSGSNSNSSTASESESEFERLYKYHQHLLEMDRESVREYLDWLDDAYKDAYQRGEIDLDEYRQYCEEVYHGLQDLFRDYLNDTEHEISMREGYDGESSKIISLYKEMIAAVEKEIESAREYGLDNNNDYVQELQSKYAEYTQAISDMQDEFKDEAKSSVEELVDIRIKMLEKDVDAEKSAIKEKLDSLKDFYDKQKEMLRDFYDEEKYLEEQEEKRKDVSDIQSSIDQLRYDDSAWAQKRKLELQQELSDAKKTLDDLEKEHALELTEKKLDEMYELQKKDLDAQTESLQAKVDDAKSLYVTALEDIRSGSVSLYEEMITWNQTYGDGIDETIKTAWEEAYVALKKYHDLFGSHYEGIVLPNATGHVFTTGSWENSPISGYASGTPNATAGIHKVNESGDEYVFTSSDGSTYRVFSGGEKVLNANATNFLYEFANSKGAILWKLFENMFSGSPISKISPTVANTEVHMGDIVIQGNADNRTVSEIRRAQRDAVSDMLKSINKLNK